ncbi:uncharacterized protein N7487_003047 [Penicillium crustosum]|uniref:uncharacterized protein n=1 Tax=Penicillium crustosum TaxID=36656 RepID=UPI00239ADE9B|nr:uncharacterized protein N7487_003047 [Penicillium crustosum]KAJ5419497.1 hypothetical protein N7487_003047 [Penicillium crustosum]
MVALKHFLQLGCMLAVVSADCTKKQQPVVDLGYEIYQATGASNNSDSYYSFSNIRYAAPPVGDLRWKHPMPPLTNRSTIQSNSESISCTQATPTWQLRTSQYLNDYLKTGIVPNVSYSDMSAISAGGVEDCLFLDVQVPRKIFDSPKKDRKLSPVLVWIHEGGGFTTGSKTSFGSSKGLIERSQAGGSEGVVYVALNYRLGAFGFLSGSSFEKQDGVLNAGLYDQRLALQWIQDNIYRFGGDKNQVTVFGESASGGSIMQHIVAHGGAGPSLFNRAVLQSPGFFPYRSSHSQEKTFKDFLALTNVTSLAEARQLPSDVLMSANSISVGVSQPYASAVYGPTPDGGLVREDPKTLLRRGEYDRSVDIVVSHNTDEGLVLIPAVHTNEEYEKLCQEIYHRSYHSDSLSSRVRRIQGIHQQLRESGLDGGDIIIGCNAVALSSAFKDSSRAYVFDMSPGIHGQDTTYTFYTPNQKVSSFGLINTGAVNQTVAFVMQDYILSFAKHGTLSSSVDGLGSIPAFGSQAKAVRLTSDNITISHDLANPRCQW